MCIGASGVISVLTGPGLIKLILILYLEYSLAAVTVRAFKAPFEALYIPNPVMQFRGAPEVRFIILPKLFFFIGFINFCSMRKGEIEFTLKEYLKILLGQLIQVYKDNKNLTFSNFNTQRVIFWRILIEEFGPKIVYIPGPATIVANDISCLEMENDPDNTQIYFDYDLENHLIEFSDRFAGEPLLDYIYLLNF